MPKIFLTLFLRGVTWVIADYKYLITHKLLCLSTLLNLTLLFTKSCYLKAERPRREQIGATLNTCWKMARNMFFSEKPAKKLWKKAK